MIRTTNTDKSFINAILALVFIAIAIIFGIIKNTQQNIILEYSIIIPLFIAALLSIIGLIQGLKGSKKQKTIKFYLSLIINFIIGIGFFTLLIISIIAISKIEH